MTGYKKRQRNASLPPVTDAQMEALDTVQCLLEKNSIPLPWERGDIVFINDMALFHARSAFKEKASAGRELIKFYLRDPEQNWPIPQTAKENWDTLFGPNKPDGERSEEWDMLYKSGEGAASNG